MFQNFQTMRVHPQKDAANDTYPNSGTIDCSPKDRDERGKPNKECSAWVMMPINPT